MKRAFTLIEFLIALVIIGFIVAILVGVFSSPVHQASIDSKVTRLLDNGRQVQDAWQTYIARRGTSPKTANGDPVGALGLLVQGGFLTELPDGPDPDNPTMSAVDISDGMAIRIAGDPLVADLALIGLMPNAELCDAFNRAAGNSMPPMPAGGNNDTGALNVSPADGAVQGMGIQCIKQENSPNYIFFFLLEVDSNYP